MLSLFVNLHAQLVSMSFNLFGKKEAENGDRHFADRVFINSTAKMNACAALAHQQPDILFIAWFEDTARIYKDFFIQQGLEPGRITKTRLLQKAPLQNQLPVFVEHYPLYSKELMLVEAWQQTHIPVYSAMDEPLFKYFGSDNMIPFIKLFGMKESNPIEHPFVSASIIKGQKKIAERVSLEQLANSQAEWMEINLP